ncbi:MAG: MFS transporter [Fusobacteriaceae bacterium]|jgi:MFS family permease|nr:MFS transporter [Fusobacteriaceae bacterium]
MIKNLKSNNINFLKSTILATVILLVSTGIRNTVGLFVNPLVQGSILSLTNVSMAMAIGQFSFGLFQPLAGFLTTKYKTFMILISGVLCLATGFLGMKFANSFVLLIVCFGILTPAGAAASSFPILMGHISKSIPDDKKAISSGLISAGGAAGQFIFAPFIQICINYYGYYGACIFLAGVVVLSIIPSWFLCRIKNETSSEQEVSFEQDNDKASDKIDEKIHSGDFKKELSSAFRNPSYIILHAGFLACGFHVAFLATHLPGEIRFFKYGSSFVVLCFSILGICNILGCALVGILGKRFKSKDILTGLYTIRVLLIILYLFLPKTVTLFIIFSAIAGFTFGSTVPPTGNIAAHLIKPKYLSTLFGLIFVTHQIGSFFGAWLGGLVMDHTGSFLTIWIIDIFLSLFAAIISFKVVESPKLHPTKEQLGGE